MDRGIYVDPKVHFGHMYSVNYKSIEEEPLGAPKAPGGKGSPYLGLGLGGKWDKKKQVSQHLRKITMWNFMYCFIRQLKLFPFQKQF